MADPLPFAPDYSNIIFATKMCSNSDEHLGPGKLMAVLSTFHNVLSSFHFLPQCDISVVPAGWEVA
jgi:hypothetical protein